MNQHSSLRVLTSVIWSVLCAQSSGSPAFAVQPFTLGSSDYIKIGINSQSRGASSILKGTSIDFQNCLKTTDDSFNDYVNEVHIETTAPDAPLDAPACDLSLLNKKDSGGGAGAAKTAGSSEVAPLLLVADVTVEGNRFVSTEDIMKVIKTRRGDKYNRELVIEDLRAINALGYFDDRSLRVDPELTPGGIILKIRVQETLLKKGLTASFSHTGVNVSHYVPVCVRATVPSASSLTGTSTTSVPGFAEYSLGSFKGVRGYRTFSDLGLDSNVNILKRTKTKSVIVQ